MGGRLVTFKCELYKMEGLVIVLTSIDFGNV